ncbi:E3 ubiquitin-protein ligase [Nymphaea thermarum]|nr:E3 ubiquitin-protein ligase [Nymphaea thermarum]
MTSASELFYHRRSRSYWRNSADQGFAAATASTAAPPLPSSPAHHHRHHHHRHRHSHHRDLDDCDPYRHPHHARQLCNRLSQIERDSSQYDEPTVLSHTSTSSGNGTSGNAGNWLGIDRSERLPGAVLQARARLLERLRGSSLTASRQSNHAQNMSGGGFYPMTSDDLRFVDAGDWEIESPREWLAPTNIYSSSRSQTETLPFSSECKAKPPGLSRQAINSLHRELFAGTEGVSVECSICLERFVVGEGLIRLPCGHRFHPVCLDPWITTCGDCPYCRTCIDVGSG